MYLLHSTIYFFFNDTATTEIYTLSLHDALPISDGVRSTANAHHGVSLRLFGSNTRERTAPRTGAEVEGTGDRKSTRLNSSHSQISYAVFCLKKKKRTAISLSSSPSTSSHCSPPR